MVPHLGYEDPFAALAWLCRVFGFTEVKRFNRGEDNLTARLKGPDGGVVMISGHRDEQRARGGRVVPLLASDLAGPGQVKLRPAFGPLEEVFKVLPGPRCVLGVLVSAAEQADVLRDIRQVVPHPE